MKREADLQRNTKIILFMIPTVALGIIFQTFVHLPIYTSLPLAVAEFYLTQLVSLGLTRLLDDEAVH